MGAVRGGEGREQCLGCVHQLASLAAETFHTGTLSTVGTSAVGWWFMFICLLVGAVGSVAIKVASVS